MYHVQIINALIPLKIVNFKELNHKIRTKGHKKSFLLLIFMVTVHQNGYT